MAIELLLAIRKRARRRTVKRLLLVASLCFISIPLVARAEDRDQRHHHKISAKEMGAVGAGIAALLGAGGYLVLRGRKAT
jgi:hypothetical protein